MGVYIKDMEMPKAGVYSCELGVLDKNTAVLTIYTPIDEPQRSFKLVPVPTPHGRLADVDALLRGCKRIKGKYATREFAFSQSAIENAPTIIEAEDGTTK